MGKECMASYEQAMKDAQRQFSQHKQTLVDLFEQAMRDAQHQLGQHNWDLSNLQVILQEWDTKLRSLRTEMKVCVTCLIA